MKNNKSIIHQNIENLTTLWKTVGHEFDGVKSYSSYEKSIISNSQWPNRVWLSKQVEQLDITELSTNIKAINSKVTIPIWDQNLFSLFKSEKFEFKFQQIGMSLNLNNQIPFDTKLQLEKVKSHDDARIWSTIFKESFGYIIHSDSIFKSINKVDYYIAIDNKSPIGTAMTYKTDNNLGVHAVGIPPLNRRKGYAKQIMYSLINKAIKEEISYLVLQASEMGKGLYKSLGFKEDFLIRNYQLNLD